MAKLRSSEDRTKDLQEVVASAGIETGSSSSSMGLRVSKPPSEEGNKPLHEALAYAQQRHKADTLSDSRVHIPLSNLRDSPYQPRMAYPEEEIQELSTSMNRVGQQEPIRVRRLEGDVFELLDGHRRTKAANLAGWETLQAIIEDRTDRDARITIMTSIETRKGLSEWERAKMYKAALDEGIVKNKAALSTLLACTRARVTQVMTVYKLPGTIQALFEEHTSQVTTRLVSALVELFQQYPNEEPLIEASVKRVLIDGTPVSFLKGWVQQQLARNQRGMTVQTESSMVLNSSNRIIFNVKPLSSGGISINIGKGISIPQAQLQKCVTDALHLIGHSFFLFLFLFTLRRNGIDR